jgi:hypothetical protein
MEVDSFIGRQLVTFTPFYAMFFERIRGKHRHRSPPKGLCAFGSSKNAAFRVPLFKEAKNLLITSSYLLIIVDTRGAP